MRFKVTDETSFSFTEEDVIARSEGIEGCFQGIADALEMGSERFEIVLPNGNTIHVDARDCDFGSWEEED